MKRITKNDVLKEVSIITAADKDAPEAFLIALDIWGEIKWKEAQSEAAKANKKRMDKNGRHPIASFTPYKK